MSQRRESREFESLRLIGEAAQAVFDKPPLLLKKPGCPAAFTWRGKTHAIVELLSEWHDYRRRGRMALNMRPDHAAAAERRGSLGVGRDHYQVRVDTGKVFEIMYDRAPRSASDRAGGWFVMHELGERGSADSNAGDSGSMPE